jgi:hypothetical protein
MKLTAMILRVKQFKNGRTSMDDNEQAGQPSISRPETLIAHVKNIISGNCGSTVRKVAEEGGISTQF